MSEVGDGLPKVDGVPQPARAVALLLEAPVAGLVETAEEDRARERASFLALVRPHPRGAGAPHSAAARGLAAFA